MSEKFKIGDRVKIKADESSDGKKYDGRVGKITKCYSNYCDVDVSDYCTVYYKELTLVEEEKLIGNENMDKKIIRVLVVDKKTGKVKKNETVVANDEQSAILKAFGVDAENSFVKTTVEGEFKEDKPVTAILVKEATKKKE